MKLIHTTLGVLCSSALALTAQTKAPSDDTAEKGKEAEVSKASESATDDEVQTEGAKVGHWTMDFEAAKELAAEKELPLILNFTGSDWCGWCKLMDKNVFAEDEWKKYASENAVLVTLDFPKDKSIVPEKYKKQNDKLKDQFEVRGFPTYVILDSDGESKIGQLGAGRDKTPESFITEFKAVVRLSPSNIEAYVKANPDKAKAYKAAIQGVEDAKKELTDWLQTKPERNEENNKKFAEFQKSIQAAQEELGKY